MKYNYVIFGSESEYYKYSYKELNSNDGAMYFSEPSLNKAINTIRKFHMTPRINRFINLPGKGIWNKIIFRNPFRNQKPICFVFFSSGSFTDHIPYGFLDYLKNTFPKSKYAVFYQDLVGVDKRRVTIETFKSCMDAVFSFDYADCEKYGLIYHSLVYSNIDNEIEKIDTESDVYFCGATKNRITNILETYEWLVNRGYRCDFHIITKKESEKRMCDNYPGIMIHESFSYLENLRHIKSCKYLLEIMQKGGTGYTIRVCEAIAFNKKIISNNLFLSKADFYNQDDIVIFNDINDLDAKKINLNSSCSLKKYISSISPKEFLRFVETYL